jgi:hypothetical protein
LTKKLSSRKIVAVSPSCCSGPKEKFQPLESRMSNLYTYSDPVLSLWQAAVAEVHRRHNSVQSRMAPATQNRIAAVATASPTPALLSPDALMDPARSLGATLKAGNPLPAPTPQSATAPKPLALVAAADTGAAEAHGVVDVVVDCAKTAAEFLAAEIKAEITGDHQQSDVLAAELKDSTCDIGWSECVVLYLAYKASMKDLPYRPNLNPVFQIDSNVKLAIVGDWGTGDEAAINLLQQVAALKPDVLIHLGDVYYAGTQSEEQTNFLDICRQLLGNSVPVYSLCGNHDMYSGGNGYYWLVDQLGQQASYFCLQNSNWQFLAMDTGHNDNNPLTVTTNMTGLVTQGSWAEEDWLLDKINLAGSKKTVLLSHHQLFSPFGSVGSVDSQAYAYNPNLRATFQAVMGQIAWWFWGHEHTLAIFNPYMGLQRGRCVGASAVPVFTDQQSYSNASGLRTYGGASLPTWNTNVQLGNNGTSYNNCFAIMTLNGASANVDYYQVPILGTATKFGVNDSA